jgi:hypothetical protein
MYRQLWVDCATLKITGNLGSELPQAIDEAATGDKINCELKRLHNDFYSRPWKEIENLKDELGVRYVENLLKNNQGMQQAMEATMSSVIIDSWTAFETLCTDLWFVALDNGPADWRKRVKLRDHKLKGDDSQTSIENIDLNQIADPQEKYGTAFRDKGVSFPKLEVIKYWYKNTFGNGAEKLFKEHKRICALSAARNALVHKAGLADRKYLNAVKDFPELHAELDKPIPLDGEIVRELRNVAIHLGIKLIQFVDGVLCRKP